MDILIPSTGCRAMGELLERPEDLARVSAAIEAAVARSFQPGRHPVRHLTGAEVNRRTEMSISHFRLMRDAGWTVVRCVDHLWTALDTGLSGKVWEPGAGRFWLPEQIGEQV